ncbi:amidase [Nitratireductor pacificus]|uniref:Amidase n=1 Tax=Nitratireductor pacificus pht-3B TaxID=391937 RepID=K2MIL1_9HYPH|nr:amidase [Nitratireductor pacificus]EKF20545.1 amidase [Nitratireductor pacificus pht-3B]
MWKSKELPEMLRAIAEFREYGFLDRIPRWEERLRVNELELKRFAEIPHVDEQPMSTAALPQRPEGKPLAGGGSAGWATPETALAIAARVQRREISVSDVAEAYIERAEAVTEMNLFTAFDADLMRREARALDERAAKGEALGPLAGVPVPVKDYMFVRGYPRTGGTRAMAPSTGHDDAAAVANLRAAGALFAGMTNLHELAYGATGINPHFGAVANPGHPGRIIGGSSSGSAGAVAAGLAPVAVGSDTSGSIRIPSAFCGVTGFKPTYDSISRDGVMPLAWSLDHLGPIAGNVRDAALLFAVMAGRAPESCVPDANLKPGRLRFGKPTNHFYDEVDTAILDRIERLIAALAGAGHAIVPTKLSAVENCLPIHVQTVTAEASQAYWQPLVENPHLLGEDVRVRLEVGQFLASVDYVKAQRLRTVQRQALQAAFDDIDVLITPTVATAAPEIGAASVIIDGVERPLHPALTRFTTPFNQSGLPAITLPCGVNAAGLPIGVQLAGPYGSDERLLEIAAEVERVIAEMPA